ncbi:hypothetical protein DL89DRAFT_267966 [Linderina pennispora]|uniref:Uncharacterized protein n=1 Tax=Linderina pennispora TaxID=61395 RepID=A0A1Y1W5X6_9FUNG|nr:uncharacterized protein DL89DRAFT_267966 [Linderina pennispora]ORX68927.1 hypothetical protein DL89DRAFT_267966 [Linderina pennispora]
MGSNYIYLFLRSRVITDAERVAAATSSRHPPRPNVIIFGGVFYGITLLLMVYCWVNHGYRPIRAKNMPTIATNGNVVVIGAWSVCKAWGLWVRVAATFTFSSAVLFRLIAFDRVFNRNKPCSGVGFYAPMVVFGLMLIVFCSGFKIAALGILWAIWLAIGVYILRVRNVQSSYNEFFHFVAIFTISVMAILYTTLLHILHPNFPFVRALRASNTSADLIVGNLCIWILMANPAYQCLFRHEAYLNEWLLALSMDGRKADIQTENDYTTPNVGSYSRMEGNINRPIGTDSDTLRHYNITTLDFALGLDPYTPNASRHFSASDGTVNGTRLNF